MEKNINDNIKDYTMDENEVKLDNDQKFDILLVKSNNITDLNWQDPQYLNKITNSDFCSVETIIPVNFMEELAIKLNVDKYKFSDIEVQTIGEDKNHLYEILYIKLDEKEKHEQNYFGSLLNINGDKIFGNLVILKTYLSLTSDEMKYTNINKKDIIDLMHYRANTKVVLYHDGDYEEVEILGEMKTFADAFFENDIYKVKKHEMCFLKHNLNIWYFEDKYGEKDVLGKLLDNKADMYIDKCIFFSMNSNKYRGNFTIDELTKILQLSNKLDDFNADSKYNQEIKDNIGRNIVYTKHRVLEQTFNLNFKN